MTKFVNSKESVISPLLLWQEVPTQVSVEGTYDLKIWPITNIYNDGPINFNLPPQPNGMLTNIDVVTRFSIWINGQRNTDFHKNLSIINNFSNALWELVEIRLDDRVELMQSMRNAYAYQSFFNTALNNEASHKDYLFENELFIMDEGDDKADAEDIHAVVTDLDYVTRKLLNTISSADDDGLSEVDGNYATKIKDIMEDESDSAVWSPNFGKNRASGIRAMRINKGQSVTVSSKLQVPLFTTQKCLPTNMKIRISLTKNTDDFLLLAEAASKFEVHIDDIYLNVTFYRPRDIILNQIEDQLKKDPAPYFITRPELIIRPITHTNRIIRINDVFHNKIPSYAFFCLQKSSDFEGKRTSSPFVFLPFSKFQFFINGMPYFVDPLETELTSDGTKLKSGPGQYLRQLYKTVGKDLRGNCLIDSTNFHLNFIVAVSFTADRSSTSPRYLNLQENGSTYLEIDLGYDNNIPDDMILITYALFDRQIKLDSDRSVTIIE